ncbi:MAG: hypothetical protein PHC85_02400 [Candidatus Pacebacteria bacterium]|nr:hypothetical protein [Candidatus Paceibacterota bacterium]
MGASFSTIPAEGELRGIDVVPIDLMHEANQTRYSGVIKRKFQLGPLNDIYKYPAKKLPNELERNMGFENPFIDYTETIQAVIEKAKSKYIVADLAKLPLKDRALSVAIVSDSVPKHSLDLKTFLEKELPEILRVTDRAAYIYPISIYKATKWKGKFDFEENEFVWKKVSDLTSEEIAEEKRVKNMDPEAYDEEYTEKTTLEETHQLYKDSKIIEQIKETAERLGFDFVLEKANNTEKEENEKRGEVLGGSYFEYHQQEEAKLGIFKRK